jgi:hypothetical protein
MVREPKASPMTATLILFATGGGLVLLGLLAIALHALIVRMQHGRPMRTDGLGPNASSSTTNLVGVLMLGVGFACIFVGIYLRMAQN